MPIIYNNLNSRILIHIKGSKYIDLLEKNTAEATDDDLLSSHLQCLIQKGFVVMGYETKKEVKIEEKARNLIEDKEAKRKTDKNLRTDKELKKEKDENVSTKNEIKREVDENLNMENEVEEEADKDLNTENEVGEETDENLSIKTEVRKK